MASKIAELGCITFLLMFVVLGSTFGSIEQDDKPIPKRHYFSLTMRSELCRFIESSSLEYVYSPIKQQNTTLETVVQNNVTVNETQKKPVNLFSPSFLTLWSSDITKAMIEASRFKMLNSSAPVRRATLSEMFQYNTSWVIGLAVCATIIGIFFLGCIIVICYSRRPYRRSGKVYVVENASKKNSKKIAAQVPNFQPITKTSTLTSQSKEHFY